MTRAPPLSGRRHIFVTFAAAVSLWRFSVCAFVGLCIEGSMNACMELVGFSTSNKVKNHCLRVSKWFVFLTQITLSLLTCNLCYENKYLKSMHWHDMDKVALCVV